MSALEWLRTWLFDDPSSTAFRAGLALVVLGGLFALPLLVFTTFLRHHGTVSPQRSPARMLAILLAVCAAGLAIVLSLLGQFLTA